MIIESVKGEYMRLRIVDKVNRKHLVGLQRYFNYLSEKLFYGKSWEEMYQEEEISMDEFLRTFEYSLPSLKMEVQIDEANVLLMNELYRGMEFVVANSVVVIHPENAKKVNQTFSSYYMAKYMKIVGQPKSKKVLEKNLRRFRLGSYGIQFEKNGFWKAYVKRTKELYNWMTYAKCLMKVKLNVAILACDLIGEFMFPIDIKEVISMDNEIRIHG